MISSSILGSIFSLLILITLNIINIFIWNNNELLKLEFFVFIAFAGFGFVLLGIIGRSRREFTNIIIGESLLKCAQDNGIILIKQKKIFITDESLSGKILVFRQMLEKAIRDRSVSCDHDERTGSL